MKTKHKTKKTKHKTKKHRKPTKPTKRSWSFYDSVNKRWNPLLPPTETRVTQTFLIQKKIDEELRQIISRHRKHENQIADLVASWDATEGQIPFEISSLLQIMISISSPSDVVRCIGMMNRYGITPPLMVFFQGDPRKQRRCCVFLEEGEPQIGSPDFWGTSEFTSHRRAYASYVKRLASTMGLPILENGYEAERQFASVFPAINERKSRINLLTWSELCRTYNQIDWGALLTAWGLAEGSLPSLYFNVTSSAFLHHLQSRIVGWPLSRWRGWLALLVTQWVAGRTPKGPLRSAWFDYYKRFLEGATQDANASSLRVQIVKSLLPIPLSHEWIRRFCDISDITAVKRMTRTIGAAAASCIHRSSWLAPATKAAAIRKLRGMDLQIGWPSSSSTTTSTTLLDSRNLVANLLSLSKVSTDENQEMGLRGDCAHPYGKGWGKPAFEVNAYYYPDENRFILPAAILRPPFFDRSKNRAWNYGAIGATIGHEMCHAFDADGRLYDEHGNKRDWWTKGDAEEYEKKARQMTRLFDDSFYRGMEVDGALTLIENIADLGGLEFALAALDSRDPAELREFFTAFAVSWRTKDRLKRAGQLLVTDMHAPPKLRVDNVVRQMDAWYVAFNVGSDNPMWIPPDKRIRFWL